MDLKIGKNIKVTEFPDKIGKNEEVDTDFWEKLRNIARALEIIWGVFNVDIYRITNITNDTKKYYNKYGRTATDTSITRYHGFDWYDGANESLIRRTYKHKKKHIGERYVECYSGRRQEHFEDTIEEDKNINTDIFCSIPDLVALVDKHKPIFKKEGFDEKRFVELIKTLFAASSSNLLYSPDVSDKDLTNKFTLTHFLEAKTFQDLLDNAKTMAEFFNDNYSNWFDDNGWCVVSCQFSCQQSCQVACQSCQHNTCHNQFCGF